MNLKSKFKYISGLLFFQIIVDLIFTIIVNTNEKKDCINLLIYLIIIITVRILFLSYPLYILSKGLEIERFYITGNLVEVGIYIFNLMYPILLIISNFLPVNTGENCLNINPFLITDTIIGFFSNIIFYHLFKNTLRNEYHLIRECVVCLESITNRELKLKCGHYFHKECILEWGIKKPNCPVCRDEFSIFIN